MYRTPLARSASSAGLPQAGKGEGEGVSRSRGLKYSRAVLEWNLREGKWSEAKGSEGKRREKSEKSDESDESEESDERIIYGITYYFR